MHLSVIGSEIQVLKYQHDLGVLRTLYEMPFLHASNIQIITHLSLQLLLFSICTTQNTHDLSSTAPHSNIGITACQNAQISDFHNVRCSVFGGSIIRSIITIEWKEL